MSINYNLYAAFDEISGRFSSKTVIETAEGAAYTYADLHSESAKVANALVSLGCRQGDRVSVQVAKSPQALFLYLGCLRAGCVFHPLNTGYKAHELDYFLSNAEPSVVVCDAADLSRIQELASLHGISNVLTLNADGSGSLSELVACNDSHFETAVCAPDDMASLLYSSGTTGVPKGIMLTHENLLSNGRTLVEFWGFSDRDVLLHALPIFHVHGLFVAVSCVLLAGGSMRWLSGFQIDQVLAELRRSTTMMGVPTYYTRLLADDRFGAEHAENMRLFVSGSAPLLEDTFYEFEARTGHRILERYGMSETGMNTSNPLFGERKAGTVGLPLPSVSVRVVDDYGVPVKSGEIGNIQVKGPNVFKGYWKLPEKTEQDFTHEGFFDTGDKGCFDNEGYLSIVGRAKDMVITGGLNVYPKEIELVIDELEGIVESAVIGVPHLDFGEAVIAVVVLKPGFPFDESELISQIKDTLSSFKVPKRILVREELPRNTMGKVQKAVLRSECESLFCV